MSPAGPGITCWPRMTRASGSARTGRRRSCPARRRRSPRPAGRPPAASRSRHRATAASCAVAPASQVTCMSWPQACITGTCAPSGSVAVCGARVGQPGLLGDRQRVHVGAQHHGRPVAVAQHPDDAGAADAGGHLEPGGLEPRRGLRRSGAPARTARGGRAGRGRAPRDRHPRLGLCPAMTPLGGYAVRSARMPPWVRRASIRPDPGLEPRRDVRLRAQRRDRRRAQAPGHLRRRRARRGGGHGRRHRARPVDRAPAGELSRLALPRGGRSRGPAHVPGAAVGGALTAPDRRARRRRPRAVLRRRRLHGAGPSASPRSRRWCSGAVTAIGGGMLRDILVNEIPGVLRGGLYAVPALLGASVVVSRPRPARRARCSRSSACSSASSCGSSACAATSTSRVSHPRP